MLYDLKFRERQLDATINKWIGSGVRFPQTWDKISGATLTNQSLSRINQSIHVILSTRIGERFFLPEFGCRLHDRVFDLNDISFANVAEMDIREALVRWEKRIYVTQVQCVIRELGNMVPISVSYKTSRTNVDGNYVWPFRASIYGLR